VRTVSVPTACYLDTCVSKWQDPHLIRACMYVGRVWVGGWVGGCMPVCVVVIGFFGRCARTCVLVAKCVFASVLALP
jgi:hypothetical protein